MALFHRIREKISCSGSRSLICVLLPVLTFIIGLIIPSPFFHYGLRGYIATTNDMLVDTINMAFPDGSVYEGSIVVKTKEREGYGKLTMKDGTIYEGEWKKDNLPFGNRISKTSVYSGHFDSELNLDGFGIM